MMLTLSNQIAMIDPMKTRMRLLSLVLSFRNAVSGVIIN
jgi:hypothetical protein